MQPTNRLKERTRAGEKSFGIWLQSTEPAFAEMAALAGFDFIIIDHEHGPGSIASAMDMMRAVSGTSTSAVVRVPAADPVYFKRILDAGAQSLLVPMVETAEDARRIVDACRYPPRGSRGNAVGAIRASGYGFRPDYLENAHESLMLVVQLESVRALANASEIARVDGVDMIFIGPADLSGSAGFPGQTGAPRVHSLIDECVAAMRELRKPLGTVPRIGRSWAQLFDQGFQLVTAGGDIGFFRQSTSAAMQEWHAYNRGDQGDGKR